MKKPWDQEETPRADELGRSLPSTIEPTTWGEEKCLRLARSLERRLRAAERLVGLLVEWVDYPPTDELEEDAADRRVKEARGHLTAAQQEDE